MNIEQFIGYVVMMAGGMLIACALLAAVGLLLGFLLHRVGKRLWRTYDLYVVEYWIAVATQNGRRIPTRRRVEDALAALDKDDAHECP